MNTPKDLQTALTVLMRTLDEYNIPCEYSVRRLSSTSFVITFYSGKHKLLCSYNSYEVSAFISNINWWEDTLIKYKEKGWL